ncbi:CheR family methyltransferase [Pelosinus fermentans]|uniref:protein-glutamate O-methyltransferase n=1 Tax=Pelosinus fermentans JBW45 TaxID=1192197 RepID=I8TV27_9FIRM|nr:protein-glutamate O-methyltransferase CheR [Pelosinus fermentans]AJQ25756.1 MCP methyltransferase, CheR-type [Pelosinus fermentans JBW45]
MKEITEREFTELVGFVKQTYGINLLHKKTLVCGRLNNYIVQSGFQSFSEYFSHVKSDHTGKSGVILVNKLTTNHTYFLREPQHFEFLERVILPYYAANEARKKDLRVWSAGCSTGEEPYTLAILINSYFGVKKYGWDTKILATDISTAVLEQAQKAVYASTQLEKLPERWREQYFTKIDAESSIVKDSIRQEVIFRRFNLMNEMFPFKKKFHLIFCRNVMIYFDAETKIKLINRFYDHMEPGGYLFIGHSESINRHESNYQFVAPAIYRKV